MMLPTVSPKVKRGVYIRDVNDSGVTSAGRGGERPGDTMQEVTP